MEVVDAGPYELVQLLMGMLIARLIVAFWSISPGGRRRGSGYFANRRRMYGAPHAYAFSPQ